jgi:hypothetical protein
MGRLAGLHDSMETPGLRASQFSIEGSAEEVDWEGEWRRRLRREMGRRGGRVDAMDRDSVHHIRCRSWRREREAGSGGSRSS